LYTCAELDTSLSNKDIADLADTRQTPWLALLDRVR
jgi:hypothetical protein